MCKNTAVIYSTVAAILYGIEPTIITASYLYGANSFSVTAYAAIGGALLFFIILVSKRISIKIPFAIFLKLVVMTTFGTFATSALLYYSYMRIPPGVAASLHYVYPVIIAIMLRVFFNEKAGIGVIFSVVLSVAGIAMISGYTSAGKTDADLIGIFAAIVSGECWAFYIVYMEKSGASSYDSRVINFYLCLITIPESLILALACRKMDIIKSPVGWLLIILLVIVGRILAGPLLQKGIHGAGAMVSGVLETLEPVTALILSILLGHDTLTASKIVGSLLVIGASLLITVQEKNRSTNQ